MTTNSFQNLAKSNKHLQLQSSLWERKREKEREPRCTCVSKTRGGFLPRRVWRQLWLCFESMNPKDQYNVQNVGASPLYMQLTPRNSHGAPPTPVLPPFLCFVPSSCATSNTQHNTMAAAPKIDRGTLGNDHCWSTWQIYLGSGF